MALKQRVIVFALLPLLLLFIPHRESTQVIARQADTLPLVKAVDAVGMTVSDLEHAVS